MSFDMECEYTESPLNSPDWGHFVDLEKEYVFTLETTSENIQRQPLNIETEPKHPLVRNKSIIIKVLEYIKRLTLIEKIYLIILNLFTNR